MHEKHSAMILKKESKNSEILSNCYKSVKVFLIP